MNKYKVIILSLLISFMGASCEDWLYDNVNEDAAHEVLPQQVLPVVLFYSAQLQFDHAEYGAYLTQTLTTGGRNQTSSFAYKSGWGDFLTMNRHPNGVATSTISVSMPKKSSTRLTKHKRGIWNSSAVPFG